MTNTNVQAAADAYARAEKALDDAQQALAEIPACYEGLHKEEIIGYLEYKENAAEIKNLAGQVAQVEELVFNKHQWDTKRAQELGIDLPQLRGGGPR